MAHSTLLLEKNGVQKQCPVGFSWTTLFFGGFPALIRGHALMGLVQIILQVITFSLSALVFAFIYNKMYINWRLENGFKFVEVSGAKSKSMIEESLGIKFKDNNESAD
jgi:hypothetical protein